MTIIIKPMETDGEIRGKAYVHWKSWHEAYSGLVSREYLDRDTLDKCVEIAYQWPDNIFVAKDGNKVVGFVGYGTSRDKPDAGEVYAIYVLSEYYGSGTAQKLMDAAIEQLGSFQVIYIWVLKENARAIRFYEKYGFEKDGEEKNMPSLEAAAIRMILKRTGDRVL